MNKERHMIMQACEEILANQGRMTGIDESLLENLQFVIGIHLRERDAHAATAKIMKQVGNDFSAIFGNPF